MLEFGDSVFYIDLKAFDKAITIIDGKNPDDVNAEIEQKTTLNEKNEIVMSEVFNRTSPRSKEVDATKYDLLKTFIEYIIDYEGESDDTLGADRALAQTPLGYKIVFNTLIKENILKEKEL
jgi:hypothetical protein